MRERLCLRTAVLIIISVLGPSIRGPFMEARAETSVEEVATGLEAPWSIDFANESSIYLTERPGRVRVVKNDVLLYQPLATLDVTTFAGGESGLLGLVLDPDFSSNRYVYLYYTTNSTGQVLNRISRFTESNGQLGGELVLLDGIKGGRIHDGGRLKIGPDRKLYATTGDANDGPLAQDPSSPNGKILRLNLDGSIPADNPDSQSLVYSLGHRHPQGLAWDASGRLFSSEHGPSGFFPSPCCNDEINLIEPGRNYGWPSVYGAAGNPDFADPILSTGLETWAPSGMTFYSASNIPEWTGAFLVATLRGQHLRVLHFDFSSTVRLASSVACLSGTYGRLRDVVQGPDGFVYIATSNRDGRGTPNQGDDKILKITASDCPPSSGIPAYVLYAAALGGAVAVSFVVLILLRSRRSQSKNRGMESSDSNISGLWK